MKIPGRRREAPVCARCGKPIEGEPAQIAKGGLRPKWQNYHEDCAVISAADIFDELSREGNDAGSGERD